MIKDFKSAMTHDWILPDFKEIFAYDSCHRCRHLKFCHGQYRCDSYGGLSSLVYSINRLDYAGVGCLDFYEQRTLSLMELYIQKEHLVCTLIAPIANS